MATNARPTPADVAALRRRIASLHRLGWSDSGIGEQVQRCRSTVQYHRHRMALAANIPFGPYGRKRVSDGVRRWLKSVGVRSAGRVRHDLERAQAHRLGWPAGVTLAESRLLAALRAGPLTLAELAARLGKTYRPSNSTTRQMAKRLAARRLVEAGWKRGDGPPLRIYRLARDVLARRKIWEAGRT